MRLDLSDKTTWPPGPWQDEPDRVQWADQATGLPCLIRRGPAGALCGYVAVEPGHPWHGRPYGDCLQDCGEALWCEHTPESIIRVHGGLTYAAFCQGDPETGICHVPEPGQLEDVWWFGFDCAHSGDIVPAYPEDLLRFPGDEYRTVGYVRYECEALANQLKAVK